MRPKTKVEEENKLFLYRQNTKINTLHLELKALDSQIRDLRMFLVDLKLKNKKEDEDLRFTKEKELESLLESRVQLYKTIKEEELYKRNKVNLFVDADKYSAIFDN